MALDVAHEVRRTRHQRRVLISPVSLKLSNTETRFSLDQEYSFHATRFFRHRRPSNHDIFSRCEPSECGNVDEIRLVFARTLQIFRTLPHRRGSVKIIIPDSSHSFI